MGVLEKGARVVFNTVIDSSKYKAAYMPFIFSTMYTLVPCKEVSNEGYDFCLQCLWYVADRCFII